jgi:small subunit ribosomal protein S1
LEKIIDIENETTLETNTFEKLLDEYENYRPQRGQIVQGKVLAMTEDAIILDVGAKRDAIVPRWDLGDLDEESIQDLSVGYQLPVYVTNPLGSNDELRVSIEKGLEQRDWERAQSHLADQDALELEVVGINRGGLLVEFGRLRGFVPNSHIPGLRRNMNEENTKSAKSKMMGNAVNVKVIEADPDKKRLVLSGKAAEESRRRARLKELKTQIGERIRGTVTNTVDFGVFVDLAGVDGLIHISRLSWEKVRRPSDILQPGDEVEVLVMEVDVDRGRVSLNRRALLPGPWDQFASRYHPGDIIQGKVKSVLEFGALVELTGQVTGLVHTSEYLPGTAPAPADALKPGDRLLVKILEINPQQERVRLSMRQVPQQDVSNWMLEEKDYSVRVEDAVEEQKQTDENEG